jgi:outer membrane protein, adhesin transport system
MANVGARGLRLGWMAAVGCMGWVLHTPAMSASPMSQCTEVAAAAVDRSADKLALGQLGDGGAGLDPQQQLQGLVREASRRSAEVGAARLLAEAADFDVEEVQASRRPQVVLYGSAAMASTTTTSRPSASGLQATAGVNVGASLFDGGRLDALTAWRSRLADAARLGQGATEERVALEAVNAALERHRYRLQAQVYHQYVRKMGCLVEALEVIVAEDKGRASELVQARKQQRQAELQREQSLATSRQFEFRLRKLVGDQVSLGDGFSSPLMTLPNLDEVQRLVERSSDLQKLQIEADAQQEYARAVSTGSKPQVSWTLGSSASQLPGSPATRNTSMSLGLQFNWALYDGGTTAAATKAALKRAEASRQTFQESLAARKARVQEQHDAAVSAFDRAKRYVEVIRDSDRVRNFTFQQWSQLGRRSLFDVMSSEGDHFSQRVAYINALVDGAQANASLRSQGVGLLKWMGL